MLRCCETRPPTYRALSFRCFAKSNTKKEYLNDHFMSRIILLITLHGLLAFPISLLTVITINVSSWRDTSGVGSFWPPSCRVVGNMLP